MRRYSMPTTVDNRVYKTVNEADLRALPQITPDDVLRLNRITDGTSLLLLSF